MFIIWPFVTELNLSIKSSTPPKLCLL